MGDIGPVESAAADLAPLAGEPVGLTDDQRLAWREAIATLNAAGRGDQVNTGLLEVYARAVVRMRAAEKHVSEFGAIVPAPRTGLPIQNPYLAVAQREAGVVARTSKQLGLDAALQSLASGTSSGASTHGKPLSLRAYAKRRGVSHVAVHKAIESGRLEHSVVTVRGRPAIADPALADQEWDARTRPHGETGRRVPVSDVEGDDAVDYAEARRRRELELGKLAAIQRETAALELAVRRGELVEASEVSAKVGEAYVAVKTKILGVPSWMRQRHPEVPDATVRDLDGRLREALEELADGR